MEFLNAPPWDGEPFVVGDVFVLRKGNHTAHCVLQTHSLGWQLRLTVGNDLLQAQMCRSQDDVLNTTRAVESGVAGEGVS